jgi:prolyl 4-hydroxylase
MSEMSLERASELFRAGQADDAVLMIRQVAAAGDPQALFVLADMTWTGNLVPQDLPRARLLFEYAGSLGKAEAGVVFTNLLSTGVAGPRNWELALARLEAEAAAIGERREALSLITAMALDSGGNPAELPQPERLAERPDVRLYRNLFTPAECAYVRKVAEPLYEPSFVYNDAREKVRDTIRTSDGAPIHWLIEDPAISAINRRIAAISGTAYEDGEPLQTLRYRPGQEYRPHFDFVASAEVRRLWTALIYLNDDYEGGGTAFPHIGLEVRGHTGDVLLFGNAAPDGGPEPLSEHAGLPVTSGAKYLATRWIRERRWIP